MYTRKEELLYILILHFKPMKKHIVIFVLADSPENQLKLFSSIQIREITTDSYGKAEAAVLTEALSLKIPINILQIFTI